MNTYCNNLNCWQLKPCINHTSNITTTLEGRSNCKPLPTTLINLIISFGEFRDVAICQSLKRIWQQQGTPFKANQFFYFGYICQSVSDNIFRNPQYSAIRSFSLIKSEYNQQITELLREMIAEFDKLEAEDCSTMINGVLDCFRHGPGMIDVLSKGEHVRENDLSPFLLSIAEKGKDGIKDIVDSMKMACLLAELMFKARNSEVTYLSPLLKPTNATSHYISQFCSELALDGSIKLENCITFYDKMNKNLNRTISAEDEAIQKMQDGIFGEKLTHSDRDVALAVLDSSLTFGEMAVVLGGELGEQDIIFLPTDLDLENWLKANEQRVRQTLEGKNLWKRWLFKVDDDYLLVDESTLRQFLSNIYRSVNHH